jgi:hypothetical protein
MVLAEWYHAPVSLLNLYSGNSFQPSRATRAAHIYSLVRQQILGPVLSFKKTLPLFSMVGTVTGKRLYVYQVYHLNLYHRTRNVLISLSGSHIPFLLPAYKINFFYKAIISSSHIYLAYIFTLLLMFFFSFIFSFFKRSPFLSPFTLLNFPPIAAATIPDFKICVGIGLKYRQPSSGMVWTCEFIHVGTRYFTGEWCKRSCLH